MSLEKGDELYDKKEYVWYLLQAGASIFSTFGYTEHKLAEIIRPTQQITLTV